MKTPSFDTSRSNDDQPTGDDRPSLTMRSGTGAPIFEHGGTTRIRRNPSRAIAALTWDGGPREIYGQVVDVSLTGCLLKTEATIELDTDVQMEVTLIGGDDAQFDIAATVRRTTTADGRQAYGLAFCTDSGEQKEATQALYSATASQ